MIIDGFKNKLFPYEEFEEESSEGENEESECENEETIKQHDELDKIYAP